VKSGILETFLVTAMFAAAIVALGSGRSSYQLSVCTASNDVTIEFPGIDVVPMQSRRLEE